MIVRCSKVQVQNTISFIFYSAHQFQLHPKYDGPCAAFTFRKITVRNFAAMQMASILDIDRLNSPDATWSEAQWKSLHAKVQQRMKQEGITPMK